MTLKQQSNGEKRWKMRWNWKAKSLVSLPGESYRGWLRSLLYLCYVFWVLINSLVWWFCSNTLGLILFRFCFWLGCVVFRPSAWKNVDANVENVRVLPPVCIIGFCQYLHGRSAFFLLWIWALQGIVILVHPSPRKCRSLFMSKRSLVQVPAGAVGECSSAVSAFCADSFGYLFHRCVTVVACKSSWSFRQKAQWQVTAKHTCTLCMWFWMKWQCELVHDYMVHTEHAPRRQQFEVAPAI